MHPARTAAAELRLSLSSAHNSLIRGSRTSTGAALIDN